MHKQPISTLTAISAGTIFKSRCQILKYSIVLDRFIRQINKENRLDHVLVFVTSSGKTYLNAFANGSKKSFANCSIAVRTTKHTVRMTAYNLQH